MADVAAAERSVIGAVLLSNGRILDDLGVEPDEFHSPALAGVYRLMLEMRRTGKAVDLVTLLAAVQASKDVELRAVDAILLQECVASTPSVASAEFYADIVSDEATRRRLKAAGHAVAQAADETEDVDSAVDRARAVVDGAAKIRVESVQFFGETVDRTIDALQTQVTTFPTPWADLNQRIGGWGPGRMYIIGARPGVGKSVAALNAAMGLVGRGAVAFVSLEMSTEEIQMRAISKDLQIDLGAMERRDLSDAQWRKIAGRREAWESVRLAILDQSSATMTSIRQFVRSVSRRAPLGAVVVDYLQLIRAPRGWNGPRQELLSDVSRELKILSREFNVPVIALSQLNRESARREDKRPNIEDLRESGSLEQDADVVILLHRDLVAEDKIHEMHMLVAKNRHGPTGPCTMLFRGHYSDIRDMNVTRSVPGQGSSYMDRTGQ
jgi:replicative DNA helicase